MFAILDKNEYKQKLDLILSDTHKFKRITRNPINELKIEVNKLIKKVNPGSKQYIIKPITGEYSARYLYGTVKIHKPNNPLRPIISQITTPTYDTAKELNSIITLLMTFFQFCIPLDPWGFFLH